MFFIKKQTPFMVEQVRTTLKGVCLQKFHVKNP
jgi:hypothetical protein